MEILKCHEKKNTKDRVALLAVSPSPVHLYGPVVEISVDGRLKEMYLRSPFKKDLS